MTINETPDGGRIGKILRRCIQDFSLDLSGLLIYTEAATGPYLFTPILAALAGAKKVYAITVDSRFATREWVKEETVAAASEWGVADRLEVVFEKTEDSVGESDIITNTGFVRPINLEMISWMKPTAVIPLMWETWEYREDELDLKACKERGILVMGTDESRPPLDMYPYAGYLAMKLLFELGLEGYGSRVLLLGGGEGLGRSIWTHFERLEIETDWFSDSDNESMTYDGLPEYFSAEGAKYDAIIVAEHSNEICLLGQEGLLTFDQIRLVNPAIAVGIISGNLDTDGLRNSGLHYYPRLIQPFGQMSYQPYCLGPKPVLELYSAGLKVGQSMARARLSGATVRRAAAYAIQHSPAMDF